MPTQRRFSRVPIARAMPLLALVALGACAQVDVKQSVKAPVLAAAPDVVPVDVAPEPPKFAPFITILPPRPVVVPPPPVVVVPPPRPIVVLPPPRPVVVVQPPRPIVVVEPPCPPPVVVVQPHVVVEPPAPEIVVPGDRAPGQWFPVTN
jgi:hypothetical protein